MPLPKNLRDPREKALPRQREKKENLRDPREKAIPIQREKIGSNTRRISSMSRDNKERDKRDLP